MSVKLSIVVPVYNRPDEIAELLESLVNQSEPCDQIVIVEDGSSISSEEVVSAYSDRLELCYLQKPNSGPGDSRNYGMERASGDYYLILDSDCVLPEDYIANVRAYLRENKVDFFGGPDAAHENFTKLQKAINYAMTSFFTTGGIRGSKDNNFQPRSFNMGISKEAFKASGGFARIHPGEDPDLTLRLWAMGFQSSLFKKAFVYHKRRISWRLFYNQVKKFGATRPILNKWHSKNSLTFWFPALFSVGLIFSLTALCFKNTLLIDFYLLYLLVIFIDAFSKTKSVVISVMAIWATIVMMVAYGIGFVKSTLKMAFSNKNAEELFPQLFFKK